MRTKRQRIEEKYHDEIVGLYNFKDFNFESNFSIAYQEFHHAKKLLGDLKGKRILDLGCGFGETAVYWALQGAKVEAIDISSKMVDFAKRLAKKYRVDNHCSIRQMTAESLRYKNNSFDYIFGDGIIHHVDINKAAREIRRVLKKEGLAMFIEPLSYNPAINIYRKLATEVRTPTEKPLKLKDISMLEKHFSDSYHREYHFFTLLIYVWFFFFKRIDPNKKRYWKLFRQLNGLANIPLFLLISLDKVFLTIFPPLRLLCWNTLIILKK